MHTVNYIGEVKVTHLSTAEAFSTRTPKKQTSIYNTTKINWRCQLSLEYAEF